MATIDPAHLAGTVIIGRYVIEGEPLHTGGFAHIYRAIDWRVADRPVAMKVLRRKYAQDDRWRSQLRTETLALEVVMSANVVVVYDRVESDPDTGLDFLVMEWISGGNLESFRLSRSAFDLDHLLTLAIGITEGVQGIHQRVAHDDINPRNIMLKDDKIPVIIDFGLSWDITGTGRSRTAAVRDDFVSRAGAVWRCAGARDSRRYLFPRRGVVLPVYGTALLLAVESRCRRF
jgi:serine/threonine protein kinase